MGKTVALAAIAVLSSNTSSFVASNLLCLPAVANAATQPPYAVPPL